MMTKCPECGSTEIVPDLIPLAEVSALRGPIFLTLVDPAKKGKRVDVGLRLAVCGACGHAELHTRYYQEVLDAHKNGYVTQPLH